MGTSLPKLNNWSFRLVQYDDGKFGVHEIYYDKKKEPAFITQNPTTIIGSTIDEIKELLQMIAKDIEKPVLPMEIFNK